MRLWKARARLKKADFYRLVAGTDPASRRMRKHRLRQSKQRPRMSERPDKTGKYMKLTRGEKRRWLKDRATTRSRHVEAEPGQGVVDARLRGAGPTPVCLVQDAGARARSLLRVRGVNLRRVRPDGGRGESSAFRSQEVVMHEVEKARVWVALLAVAVILQLAVIVGMMARARDLRADLVKLRIERAAEVAEAKTWPDAGAR